ncbi:hypothetical protein OQA88_5835 [Cercophora sp. LCS_1]
MDTVKTVRSNLAERHRGFLLGGLPATLRDAVVLTRNLGIQYIWIDALCIVQDSHGEWAAEAGNMMGYYANAYVTIVPRLSTGADKGFHANVEHTWLAPSRLSGLQNFGPAGHRLGTDIVLAVYEGNDTFRPSELGSDTTTLWDKRGWTLQERLNSSRILFIYERRVVLGCRAGEWDSLYGFTDPVEIPFFLPFRSSTARAASRQLDDTWRKIASSYMCRDLTYPEDRWYVFIGIARTFTDVLGLDTVLGLRRTNIFEDMCSWHLSSQRRSSQQDLHPDRRIPSWSWLTACGVVDYFLAPSFSFAESHATLLSSPTAGDDIEPWSMELRIKAPLFKPEWLLSVMERFQVSAVTPSRELTEDENEALLHNAYNPHPGRFCLDHHDVHRHSISQTYECSFPCCLSLMHRRYANVLTDASVLLMGSGSEYSWGDGKIWCFLLVEEIKGGGASGLDPPGSISLSDHVQRYRRVGTMIIRDRALNDAARDILNDLHLAGDENRKEIIRLV